MQDKRSPIGGVSSGYGGRSESGLRVDRVVVDGVAIGGGEEVIEADVSGHGVNQVVLSKIQHAC